MPHRSSQSGVSLTEYGMVLACVACLCIAALQSLGSQISGNLNFITKEIGKVSGNLGTSSPPSTPVNPPNLDVGINGTGMSPYPNGGIAGSVAGVDKNNPPGGVDDTVRVGTGKPPTGTNNGSSNQAPP
jgi:Flp pilus assembly pilin Flp